MCVYRSTTSAGVAVTARGLRMGAHRQVQALHDVVGGGPAVCHCLGVHQLPHIRLNPMHIIGVVLQVKQGRV